MRMHESRIREVQNLLSIPKVQQFDRGTVWLLMRHIEGLEEEIKRGEKSASYLQDAVIRLLQRKRLPWWKRIFRKRGD